MGAERTTLTLHGAQAAYGPGPAEVAPGVWVFLQPNGGWGETNCGLLLGKGEGLLVDTPWDGRLAAVLVAAWLRRLGGSALRYAVNTHADGDHWWGNGFLPQGTEIVTSARVQEAMAKEAKPSALAALGGLAKPLARLPGPQRRFASYLAGMLGPFDFQTVRLRYPDRTFAGLLALEVGGREVQLVELGAAHSPADVAVYVPEARVVFTGDLLFVRATPIMWGGPLSAWVAALERLLALDADLYIPGHGPPAGRPALLELKAYLSALAELCGADRESPPWVLAGEFLKRYPRWRGWVGGERVAITIGAQRRVEAGRGYAGRSVLARLRLLAQCARAAALMAPATAGNGK